VKTGAPGSNVSVIAFHDMVFGPRLAKAEGQWQRLAGIIMLRLAGGNDLASLWWMIITVAIAKLEPLWWAGFMESAREQSVMTVGFHRPAAGDLLKLVRTAPVFLLGLVLLPWFIRRRKEFESSSAAWPGSRWA